MTSITAGSHSHDDAHAHAHAHAGSFLSTYVFSKDHKIIGIQFLFSGLWWVVVFPAVQLCLIVLAVNLLGVMALVTIKVLGPPR